MSKCVNEAGNRYGRLTVIERAPRPEWETSYVAYWRCVCDCGQEHIVNGRQLRRGMVHSCGCLRSDTLKQRALDLTGQRFGRLVAIERVPAPKPPRLDGPQFAWWRCKCDCGGEKIAAASNLKKGKNKSCGCLRRKEIVCK